MVSIRRWRAYSTSGGALARRIAFSDDDLARADFEWATAAMFAAQSVSEIAEAMPDLAQVQRVVDLPAFSR